MQPTIAPASPKILNLLVVTAALGYFVDIYDLILFSIVRVPSLQSLGFSGADLLEKGVLLLNMQMIGMLLGGILWGIWGDKRGRVSVLFGSILLYSIANIANGLVQSIDAYAIWRFIAGIGLAGELGAGITLVAETLPTEKRGYATMIVATVGVSGAVFAGLISEYFAWRTAFFSGGILGLLLLILRMRVYDSRLFEQIKTHAIQRGKFFSLFSNRACFTKYLKCILIGIPLWFVVGILVTFSPEITRALGASGTVVAGRAVMFCYGGLVVGDFLSGTLSQYFRTRKKVVFAFLILSSVAIVVNFMMGAATAAHYYLLYFVMGIACGYWVVFVTIAAEQFGTNLRATVATTVPNFVRGSVVLLTLSFKYLTEQFGVLSAAAVLAVCVMTIAFVALFFLEETAKKELDFLEPL